MFREALCTVQQHSQLPRVAIAGFLRDDGTAVCKRRDWILDQLSLYKIVLLNLRELKRLRVEYLRDLKMYEDICMTHQVLSKAGHTLKCQSYCYRAVHAVHGGCDSQRQGRGTSSDTTQLEQLMTPAEYRRASTEQQELVRDLLQWVRAKEAKSAAKSVGEDVQKALEKQHAQVDRLFSEQKRASIECEGSPSARKKRRRSSRGTVPRNEKVSSKSSSSSSRSSASSACSSDRPPGGDDVRGADAISNQQVLPLSTGSDLGKGYSLACTTGVPSTPCSN